MTAIHPSLPGLEEAALAPMRRSGRGYRIGVLLLALLTAAGIGAFIYQFSTGIGVTGMNDQVFWGIYTVDLVTLIGFSYGGAVVSAILRLTNASWRGPISRLAEGTALATLAVGAVFPLASDGHPERVWRLVTAMQINSPIMWDMVAIVTYLIATIILFALPAVADLGRLQAAPGLEGWRRRWFRAGAFGWSGTAGQHRVLDRSLTALAIMIVPLAVMVHTVLSYAFSLTSRPGWHSTIFGPYFVVAAIYSGVALVVVVVVAFRRIHHLERWIPERAVMNLGYLMAALGVLYGYLLFTEMTTEGYVGAEATERLMYALLLDRWSVLFWVFVAVGLVVPLLIIAFRRTRTVAGVTVAAGLVAGALFLKRFLMFIPPLTEPQIGGEIGGYTPSWVEIMVTVGALAAIPLLLVGLFKVVPVLAVTEMEEIAASRGEMT
ncbi:MAG: polysulfide reductase NrfD [Acidimicrobiia bacterium]|nr:polysulfide reductase NrfD [Acidimicrobiia bacterium]